MQTRSLADVHISTDDPGEWDDTMNYEMLEKVICDTIKEEQIKLGYEKETIRLYYPMSSIAHILEEEITDQAKLEGILAAFVSQVEPRLGKIDISHKEERYCILIPPEGSAYVHEHYEDNPFLVELIEAVRQHDCTLEQLLQVFHKYSEQVECEKSKSDEFDYVIYFSEPSGDDYRYCFKFEHGHAIYHRFLKQDFQNLYVIEAPEPIDAAKEVQYKRLTDLMKAINCMRVTNEKVEICKQAAKQLIDLAGYKDSEELAEECKQIAKQTKKDIKKKIYKRAQKKRQDAKKALEYKAAAEEFRKLGTYKDSEAMATECEAMSNRIENRFAVRRIGSIVAILLGVAIIILGATVPISKYTIAGIFKQIGSYETAADLYQKLDNYRDSESKRAQMEQLIVKFSEVGDTVKLGNSKWRVLTIKENQALLTKEAALTAMPYHSEDKPVTWEDSSLRKWLNKEYLQKAFTQEERALILLSGVENEDNPAYGTDGGNATEDYIFLLSVSEAKEYQKLFPKFKSNSWLRTPGNSQNSAAFLSVDGTVMEYGYAVTSEDLKVRPAIWFNIK